MRRAQRWIEPALLLLAASAAWVARYAAEFGLHLDTPAPWFGWFDQGRYIRSAAALVAGNIDPAAHWYPLPYPLLAAPFVGLTPGDPFFVPDALLFGGAAVGFATAMRSLGLPRAWGTATFVAAALIAHASARLWLEPWTTTLSAFLIWWLLAGCAALVEARDTQLRAFRLLAIGALATLLAMTRPADGLVAAAATGAALLLSRKIEHRTLGWIAAGAGLAAAPIMALHLAIYGLRVSDYVRAGYDQGFAIGDLGWKASVVIVTAKPWFPKAPSLFEMLPWLIPGTAGILAGALSLSPAQRRAAAVIAAAAIPSLVLGLTYTDLQPPGLWRFGNAHYFKWLLPLFGAGLLIWLASFGVWRRWAVAMASTLAVLLVTCIRLTPVPVSDATPARMLLFRSNSLRQWNEAYFASSTIRDSKGSLVNVGQFHQVPDVNTERAIAVKRLFAAHPQRWDPGDTAPYTPGQAPYARYATRVSVGAPCWLSDRFCRMP